MTPVIIALLYFGVLSVGSGLILSKKVKSGSDFLTASGTLSWPLVMAAFVLAPLGAGHTLSLWEASAGLGAGALWWGILSGGVFVPLFLLWFGPWFRSLNVQTFPEGFGKIFGEEIGWTISAVFPAQLIGICIAEVTATAAAIYSLGGGTIPFAPWCILIAVVLTIAYIFAAGIRQAAWMNLFNAFMLIVGSFAAVFAVGSWLGGRGGWESVAAAYAAAGEGWKTTLMNFSPGVVYGIIFPVLVLTVFMCSASQAQCQPILAAKSDADVRKGVFWAAFINSLAAYPWVVLGLVGMSIPEIAAKGAKLSVPELAMKALPPWMVGILMISLLSATLSTTGGLILASSHIIAHDIFRRALNPKMSDETFFKLTRILIVVCALVVTFPALKLPYIFSIFMWTFSFAVPVFGVYLIGMLWKVNKTAAWITILAAYAANFIWTFWTPGFLPPELSINFYPVFFVTVVLGVVLNLVLPGEPGILRQMREARKAGSVSA